MRDIIPEIERWLRDGKGVAIATVVKVWGSAPRPLGAKMAVSDGGEMAGSVSGGCIEGAVFEEAQDVIASGAPKLVEFGVSDDEAWAVGLSCGGTIEVSIAPLDEEIFTALAGHLAADRLCALATVLRGPGRGRQLLVRPDGTTQGGLGRPQLEEAVMVDVRRLLTQFAAARRTYSEDEGVDGEASEVFIEVHPPRARLIIVGAVHVAIPLITCAQTLGFETIVVDPRTAFATPERFAHADRLITDWPDEALRALALDEASFVVLLSHDLKLDIPALTVALPSPARYIGALGSKKTHGKRVAALEEAGLTAAQIARIHNPIGLPLGGRRAEEIAVSILAEMVAVNHGRSLDMV